MSVFFVFDVCSHAFRYCMDEAVEMGRCRHSFMRFSASVWVLVCGWSLGMLVFYDVTGRVSKDVTKIFSAGAPVRLCQRFVSSLGELLFSWHIVILSFHFFFQSTTPWQLFPQLSIDYIIPFNCLYFIVCWFSHLRKIINLTLNIIAQEYNHVGHVFSLTLTQHYHRHR